jgi:hypothetical protein
MMSVSTGQRVTAGGVCCSSGPMGWSSRRGACGPAALEPNGSFAGPNGPAPVAQMEAGRRSQEDLDQ